ncbi:hypothetical protein [Actinophytocola sp. KF-1]
MHAVLAAVALAAIAVWGTGTDPARAGGTVTVPDADPRLPVNPEAVALVRPSGLLVMDTTHEKRGAALAAVLPEGEAKALGDAGAVYVKARVGRHGEFNQGVWEFAVRDGASPADALDALDDLYAAGGWTEADAPAGVLLRRQVTPLVAYRAHYVRGPYVIRVEAYGPDPDRVGREFATLLGRQLAQWPPR